MRTRLLTIRSKVSFPFAEDKTVVEIIKEKLTELYDKASYDWGKITEIVTVVPDALTDTNLYETSFNMEVGFVATVKLLYFNQGDVLFGATLKDEKAKYCTIHHVGAVNSVIPIAIQTAKELEIDKANVMVIGFDHSANARYYVDFAIYPNYSPILAGRERAGILDVGERFYLPTEDTPPKKLPAVTSQQAYFLDPLSHLSS